MDTKNKRNFILLGHAQSGKTSLAESMLFFAHATTRKGAINEGNTVSDYSFDEIERKSSINAGFLYCDYKGCRIQMVDAPGYADFFGEPLSSARAVDSAIIVVDAASGIEVGTEKAWDLAEEQNLPVMFFLNKIDKEGASAQRVLADLKSRFSKACVIIETLEDPDLMEAIAESDDTLLATYLDTLKLSVDQIKNGLKQAVVKRKLFPVLSGSAVTDKRLQDLLEDIIEYMPNPLERAPVLAEDKEVSLTHDGPFSAFVFKTIVDPYVGQLTLLRVFSGSLSSNGTFYNATKKLKEKFGSIYILQGKEQRAVEAASCGDIVAIAKLKDTVTGDSLANEKSPVLFEPLVFPEPAISASVKPKSRADEDKISLALHKLAAEDPTFHFTHDPQSKELIISGMGDLHLAIMVGRIKKRFNVEVELGTPKVSYKETITKKIKVQGKFKRQSGGRGQYGDVWIEIEPKLRGEGFEFVDKIFGGAIPRNYIPSAEKGILQACSEGAVAGYPIVDLKVTLVDGSYHDVDSSDMAFQIAGAMALRKAVAEAGPVLLEPVMQVDISIPEDCLGGVSGDINSRRGHMAGMEVKGKTQVLKASIPLAEMFTYANDLRSLTGGRGSYTMRFSHYAEVPHKIASTIISHYQASRKQDAENQ
ncbi:MAG: elongation factor G [Candidatus Omnitrophica bacterium]|jgi:elongation factor G|nr:elongation factor G [Candidatus Omnitrophota bacterium]